jgi:hypothetical protein
MSPSCEARSWSTGQEITRLLWIVNEVLLTSSHYTCDTYKHVSNTKAVATNMRCVINRHCYLDEPPLISVYGLDRKIPLSAREPPLISVYGLDRKIPCSAREQPLISVYGLDRKIPCSAREPPLICVYGLDGKIP